MKDTMNTAPKIRCFISFPSPSITFITVLAEHFMSFGDHLNLHSRITHLTNLPLIISESPLPGLNATTLDFIAIFSNIGVATSLAISP